jgi:hypothetical protein
MGRIYRQFMICASLCFIISEMVVGAAQLTARDFMAAYETWLPGESIDGVDTLPCLSQMEMSASGAIALCHFDVQDGMVSRVMIVVSDQVITRTDFTLIPYRFRLGDAILCWGKPLYFTPTYPETDVSLNVYWDNQLLALVSSAANTPRPNYFLPITYISIQRQWKPIDRERLRCASV